MNESYSPEYDRSAGVRRSGPEGYRPRSRRSSSLSLLLATALMAAVTAGYFYISAAQQRNRELEFTNRKLVAAVKQFQMQLQTMSEQMSVLQSRTPPSPVASRRQRGRLRPAGEGRVAHTDPRLLKIQSQLAAQQKQISDTRADIDRTRSDLSQARDDLANNISSTRNELDGSIARTHDEVVALQKRNERNYYEFAIDKSKQFSRVGPMSIALRKADSKHKRVDMTVLVNDDKLQKNGVSLYETVWINLSDLPQPIELVVNKIAKNHIEGYLSEPKYKKSELQLTVSKKPANDVAKPGNLPLLH